MATSDPRPADAPLEVVRWTASQTPCSPCSQRHSAGRLAVGQSADTVLASRTASNLIVATGTASVAAVCVADGGLVSLITNLPALGVVWGALYGLIRIGRGWRGVQPSRHFAPRGQAEQVTRWQIARSLTPGRRASYLRRHAVSGRLNLAVEDRSMVIWVALLPLLQPNTGS